MLAFLSLRRSTLVLSGRNQLLLEKFIEVFGVEKRDCLLGDREFIGKKWFAYLQKHHLKFCIRMKKNILVLVSNYISEALMDDYKKRWKIAVLFYALKSRGFRFEETHLTDGERLHKLFSVVTLAFYWAYHVGAWRHIVKPITIKKHQRPAQSIFSQ